MAKLCHIMINYIITNGHNFIHKSAGCWPAILQIQCTFKFLFELILLIIYKNKYLTLFCFVEKNDN